MSLLEEVATFRQNIKTDSYSPSVKEIVDNYIQGDWVIRPAYQRLFRWDMTRQSEFIESLLLSIPTPPIFIAANKVDGRYEIIDGLQRVSTLIKFFSEDVKAKLPEEEWVRRKAEYIADSDENNIFVPSTLWAGGLLKGLDGAVATSLPDAIARTLRHSRIPVIILEAESSIDARYHVFKRLNRSAAILSDQEIRNCTARLIDDKFADRLRVLGGSETVKKALSLSEEQEKSMIAEECILRLLANAHSATALSHKVSDFLDSFMAIASKGEFVLTPEVEKRVLDTFDLLNKSSENTGAFFRRWKNGEFRGGQFSTNLFDIVATGVYSNVDHLTPELVNVAFQKIMNGDEINELTGAGSNTKKKFEARIAFGKAVFSKND